MKDAFFTAIGFLALVFVACVITLALQRVAMVCMP